jgi:3-dehydroquinate dehydratase-1
MSQVKTIKIQGRPLGGGALPAIVAPLVGATPQAILDEVAAIVAKAPDLLEWRVDFFAAIGDAQAVIDTALAIRRAAGGIPVLLTRRNVSEGGTSIPIGEAQVVAMYAAACAARCVEMIDYELSNDAADLQHLREVSAVNGVLMIMSYHNFQLTPDAATLDSQFAAAQRLGADVAKVAVMPRDAQDVLALLAATDRARQALDIPLISMSMGGVGSLSRIVGWVYGSAATFAVGKSSSAPGQIAIEDLRAVLAVVHRAVGGP